MGNKSEKNWWEFYGIRYAQGTVIGAMIVYVLFSRSESLKKILFLPTEAKDFGIAHLTLLAVYGLTYCYVASAPILVFHAGRALFYKSETNLTPERGRMKRILSLCILALPLPVWFYCDSTGGSAQLTKALAILLITGIVAAQVIVLVNIFYLRWKETVSYIKAISEKREAPESAGYVESYKHMREHGNSFFIVTMQFLLAIPIFVFVSKAPTTQDDPVINLCLIVFVWAFPASAIWAFSNKLENSLQDKSSE